MTKAETWRSRRERGAVLVEFAIAMFVFCFLTFGVIELMRAFLTTQVIGEGARVAAREAAVLPGLNITAGTTQAPAVFDERFTAIETATDNNVVFVPSYDGVHSDNITIVRTNASSTGNPNLVTVDDLFRVLPPLHSALRSVMIHEFPREENGFRNLLRFPGLLLYAPSLPRGGDLLVVVPVLEAGESDKAVPDVDVKHVVELVRSGSAGNVILADVYYDFEFATIIPLSASTGVARKPYTFVNFTNIPPGYAPIVALDLLTFKSENYGLGRPGYLHNSFVSNLRIPLRMTTATRRELP